MWERNRKKQWSKTLPNCSNIAWLMMKRSNRIKYWPYIKMRLIEVGVKL